MNTNKTLYHTRQSTVAMSYDNPTYDAGNPYELSNPYEEESNDLSNHNNDDKNATYHNVDTSANTSGDFVEFMTKINNINGNLQVYERNIDQIDRLQKQLLVEINDEDTAQIRHQLDTLAAETRSLQNQLKFDIKDAQRDGLRDTNKQTQAENSRQRFLKLIQDYRIIESNCKEENKQQAKRQYLVVQPEATEEEVENAINDANGQQIFSQALLNANRRGEAKTALAEVQQRHQELLQLEKSMAELNQLFNDMEELVIEQQENVDVIDKNVEDAQQDVEQGVGYTNKAVDSARRARRNKIRCYIIAFIAFAIVVVVVVVPSVVETRK